MTSHSPAARTTIRNLSQEQCLSLLTAAAVGRVGFVSADGIQILPVNYRLGTGPRLFVKTQPWGILGQLAEGGAEVAFEVDYHGSDLQLAWSVLMTGVLCRLDRAGTAAYTELARSVEPLPGYHDSRPVQFVPRTFSGRHIQ